MSRRHADIWSHPGHYLVDPYTWPWSPNDQDHIWLWKFKYQGHGPGQTHWSHLGPRVQIDMFVFHFSTIGPLLVEIEQIPCLTLKIQGQGHGQDQIRRSHLRPRIKSMSLLFVSWQSDHFGQRYSKFHIWPWKLKVKVTTKIDQNLIRQSIVWGQQSCKKWKKSKILFKSYGVNKNLRTATAPAAYEPEYRYIRVT